MIKKLSITILLILMIITISYFLLLKPRLPIITGYAAKKACSCLFIADRPLKIIEKQDLASSPVNFVDLKVNEKDRSVTSTIFGQVPSTAKYTKGLGCSIETTNAPKFLEFKRGDFLRNKNFPLPQQAWPLGDAIAEQQTNIDYSKLEEAFKIGFDEGDQWKKKTRALLVVQNGKLIKEKYSKGFDKDEDILGWSMTKSITNILMGILNKDKGLLVTQDNLFPEWKNDDRRKITLNDLMRMSSGLYWEEEYAKISPVTKMLFAEPNAGQYALEQKKEFKPGTHWEYSSGTTNILSLFIRNQFNSHTDYLAFPYRDLFNKLDMESAFLETDNSGHYVLSSYCFATPRDWAKLGLLYLNEGQWNGDTIFTKEWHDYSIQTTADSKGAYGAQIWLNRNHVFLADAPEDMYYFSGFEGQYVIVIPHKKLVIVRMGLSKGPDFDLNNLIKNIIDAVN